MRGTGLVLLIALAAGAGAETKLERGKRVVDEAVTALGGEKFLSVRNRVESGRAYSFYNDKLTGLAVAKFYTLYLDAPPEGKLLAVRERQGIGKDERYGSVLFTDDTAYQISFRGATPMPEANVTRYRESTLRNIFYILRERLKEPGLVIESQGADIIDNNPVELVEIADGQNRSVVVAFHRTTKLPLQQVFFRRDPDSKERIEEKAFFTKYRDVGGGVMWPFAIWRMRNGDKIFEQYSEDVKINQKLPEGTFALPAGVKILDRK